MKISRRSVLLSPEFLTGLFCTGAFIILFYFTVLIRGNDIFDTHQYFYISASFPNAGALAVKDKVKVLGVDMGTVDSLTLAEGNSSIIVRLKLRKYIPIYEGYSITIQSSSVFGGAYVNIVPGDVVPDRRLPENLVFTGKHPIDLIREASELIASFREDEKHLREFVIQGGILDKIKDALSKIEENARNLNDICAEVKSGRGTLGKLFTDEDFYNNAKAAFTSLSGFTQKFDRLLSDVEAGKGAAGFLFRDQEAAQELNTFIVSMNKITAKINSDKSVFSKLMSGDHDFLRNLESVMRNMERITSSLESGKGSLGKLLKDDALYNEMNAAVKDFRTAVNDFREMAPVATFGSVLLGAF